MAARPVTRTVKLACHTNAVVQVVSLLEIVPAGVLRCATRQAKPLGTTMRPLYEDRSCYASQTCIVLLSVLSRWSHYQDIKRFAMSVSSGSHTLPPPPQRHRDSLHFLTPVCAIHNVIVTTAFASVEMKTPSDSAAAAGRGRGGATLPPKGDPRWI